MSKRLLTAVLAVLSCAMLMGCRTSLMEAKRKVAGYYEGGEYARDVASCMKAAEKYLPVAGAYNAIGSAVVFDVDDTMLSTYEYQKGMGFGHYGLAWHEWLARGKATAIKPVLDFYNLAKSRNVVIFIVTGRREKFREATEDNLKAEGYDGWKEMYMKPTDYKEKSAALFKQSMRQRIEAQGYKIILNIGDARSDLSGGHAEHTVLLPNLIYEAR